MVRFFDDAARALADQITELELVIAHRLAANLERVRLNIIKRRSNIKRCLPFHFQVD